MTDSSIVSKIWNLAGVLRDDGVGKDEPKGMVKGDVNKYLLDNGPGKEPAPPANFDFSVS